MKAIFLMFSLMTIFSSNLHAELVIGKFEGKVQSELGLGKPCQFSITIDPTYIDTPFIFKWLNDESYYVFKFTYATNKYPLRRQESSNTFTGSSGTSNYHYGLFVVASQKGSKEFPTAVKTTEYNYVRDLTKEGLCGDIKLIQ